MSGTRRFSNEALSNEALSNEVLSNEIHDSDSRMRSLLRHLCSALLIISFVLLLPIGPFLLSLASGKSKYARDYFGTLRRAVTHLRELLAKRAITRYFNSLWRESDNEDVTMGGHCNRCGACCLNRKCIFLEQTGEKEYACGIYGTTLRKFTNCGPYPQSQFDIELYNCPTYYVIRNIPVRTYPEGMATPAPIRKSR